MAKEEVQKTREGISMSDKSKQEYEQTWKDIEESITLVYKGKKK